MFGLETFGCGMLMIYIDSISYRISSKNKLMNSFFQSIEQYQILLVYYQNYQKLKKNYQ